MMMILLLCCKEKYDAPVKAPVTGYLVIEGFVSANGPAQLHLSRSIPLNDTAKLINETLAKVQLQGKDNTIYALGESTGGMYTIPQLTLNTSQLYRLYIKTRDGKEYASEYVNVRTAPAIDSVGWLRENGGVQLYVNTHDPKNNTWYYRWETEETWEFHSTYLTNLDFLRDPISHRIVGIKYRRPDMLPDYTLYTCYKSEYSSNIILGSSAKLSIDSIHKPLVYIEQNSWKLSVLYSLLVKQYALTKGEYDFLSKMKSNTEETGSIFGHQPSELNGNIHCITNASEPVIGYFGIANRQEKRIWIRPSDVPDWRYYMQCESYEVPVDSAEYYSGFMPTMPVKYNGPAILTYLGVEPGCVDCTIRGTNVKPSFWP